MNSKITLPELVTLLAERTGTSKRQCEGFVKALFSSISVALVAHENVRLKGLGTFRLTEIDPRKSVDVNTGREIEIAGHYRVSFTAEKGLAELINRPFEHFETVELADEVTEAILEEVDSLMTDSDVSDWALKPEEEKIEPEVTPTEEPEVPIEPSPIYNLEEETEQTQPEPAAETPVRKPFALTPPSRPVETPSEKASPAHVAEVETASEPIGEALTDDKNLEELPVATSQPAPSVEKEPTPRKPRHNTAIPTGIVAVVLGLTVILMALAGMWWWQHRAETMAALTDTVTIAKAEISIVEDTDAPADSALPEVAPASTAQDTVKVKATAAEEKAETTVIEEKKVTEKVTADTKPSNAPQYDVIGQTRYLTTMAKAHYGNYHLWPYIYEANKNLGHPDRIRPGTKILIPDLAKLGVDPNNPADIAKAKSKGVAIYARYGNTGNGSSKASTGKK